MRKVINVAIVIWVAFLLVFEIYFVIKVSTAPIGCSHSIERVEYVTITPDANEVIEVSEISEPSEPVVDASKSENTSEEVTSQIDDLNLGEFRLTAYCSCEKCCGKYALNRPLDENGNQIVYTASGEIAVAGYTIAVDPSVIPYGSEVIINGHTYIAEDCGGSVKGNKIDICFPTHYEAL
jgi:3D (Asp-Asp-Asp) domain-containing protein